MLSSTTEPGEDTKFRGVLTSAFGLDMSIILKSNTLCPMRYFFEICIVKVSLSVSFAALKCSDVCAINEGWRWMDRSQIHK